VGSQSRSAHLPTKLNGKVGSGKVTDMLAVLKGTHLAGLE